MNTQKAQEALQSALAIFEDDDINKDMRELTEATRITLLGVKGFICAAFDALQDKEKP